MSSDVSNMMVVMWVINTNMLLVLIVWMSLLQCR